MTKDIHDRLRSSFMFNASLGSQELFHSNIWKWLVEQDQSFAAVFFDGIGKVKVAREEKNRDLTFWSGQEMRIIENKLKSLPRREQILEYEEKAGKAFRGGVLTGILRPSWMDGEDVSGWKFMPYSEISQKIKAVATASKKLSKLQKKLVSDYCQMLDDIDFLLQDFLSSHQKKLATTEECQALQDVRLADIACKLSAEQFIEWLRLQPEIQKIKAKTEKLGLKFFLNAGFAKKHSTIDVRLIHDSKPMVKIQSDYTVSSPWLYGVQIEDISYARFVQVNDCMKKADGSRWTSDQLFEEFSRLGWLPSKDKLANPLKVRVQYGRYAVEGKYQFIYQPDLVLDMSYESLKKRIIYDMEAACKFGKEVDIDGVLSGSSQKSV